MTPARREIRTCKENQRIAGREPNARQEKQPTTDDKGPYHRRQNQTGADRSRRYSDPLSVAGRPARLAASDEIGEYRHLQGVGGASE